MSGKISVKKGEGEEEVAVVVHFYLHVHMLTYIHMFIYREKHKSYNYTCILHSIHNTQYTRTVLNL